MTIFNSISSITNSTHSNRSLIAISNQGLVNVNNNNNNSITCFDGGCCGSGNTNIINIDIDIVSRRRHSSCC